MADLINHAPHYNQYTIEPITVIEDWNLGFHLGNCVKYIARHPFKGGLEDLKKARWYLDRYIAVQEAATSQRSSAAPAETDR